MLHALSKSLSGIKAFQGALDQTADNMANVNNEGYKSSRASFSDLYYKAYRERRMPVDPPEDVREPQTGKGVRVATVTPSFEQGELKNTGRALDLAVDGEGFFRVIRPDGTEGYTRKGDFYKDVDGNLVNSTGDFLDVDFNLEDIDASTVSISPQGEVTGEDEEGETVELGELELYRFVNPDGLYPEAGNQYTVSETSGDPEAFVPGEDGAGEIQQSFLEGSNVDLSQEFTELIRSQRALESNTQAMSTANELWMLTLQAKR